MKILTHVKGLEFDQMFGRAVLREFDSVPVRVIDLRDLIAAKKAANRPKDQDDLEHLT
jgi:hypothetical protein